MISCDRAFESLMNDVEDNLNISMDFTTPGGHESAVERNNRTTRE